jgi:hypothetical protein
MYIRRNIAQLSETPHALIFQRLEICQTNMQATADAKSIRWWKARPILDLMTRPEV